MNLLLVGYGKMGRLLEEKARERGFTPIAAVDPSAPKGGSVSGEIPLFSSLDEALGEGRASRIEAALEFSSPAAAASNLRALGQRGIPTVCGTTGWYQELPPVAEAFAQGGAPLCYGANFSLGVNLFYRIAWYAAELMEGFPEYDVGGLEVHHNKKADSPSGTAKTLAEGVLARMKRLSAAAYDTGGTSLEGVKGEGVLHFPSLRVGSVPGLHELIFDSPADSIEIRHNARNREGFASGALLAVQWLISPDKKQGIFTMDDVLKDLLP